MAELIEISAAFLGFTAVLLGAFGAHRLQKIWPRETLQSFETGIRYQMYHSLVLLFLGFQAEFQEPVIRVSAWCFLTGTVLFSFSIYALCYTSWKKRKIKFLGPLTPLGGLLLLCGWGLLLYYFVAN